MGGICGDFPHEENKHTIQHSKPKRYIFEEDFFMKKTRTIFGTHFCGNEISDYGKQNGFVDYATLAKSFDAVMCNGILSTTAEIGYWDMVSGSDVTYEDSNGNILDYEEYTDKLEELQERLEEAEAEDNLELISELENEIDDLEHSEHYSEIFQYFIISEQGASILEEYTNEIVYYNEALDLYVWGVTHCGTSWDYVLTDIPCERSEKA